MMEVAIATGLMLIVVLGAVASLSDSAKDRVDSSKDTVKTFVPCGSGSLLQGDECL